MQAVSAPPRTLGSAPLSVHPDRRPPNPPCEKWLGASTDSFGTSRSSRRTATSIRDCCWTTKPFTDPTSLLLQPDHYVTRLLHANGVSLADLGVGEGPLPEQRARKAWRLLCENWRVFRGTPVRYWFDSELGDIFGVTSDRAPTTPTRCTTRSAPSWPRTTSGPAPCSTRFGINVLATTDDPADDLAAHDAIAAGPDISDQGDPDVPSGPVSRTRPAGLDRRSERPRRRRAASTSASTPDTSKRWRNGAGSSSPAAPSPPTTATCDADAEPLEHS